MNIDTEINSYLSRLSKKEKELLLSIIKNIDGKKNEFSLAERIVSYNNELEEAVQKIKSGGYINHADVLNETDEW
jgi:hypothetical protein